MQHFNDAVRCNCLSRIEISMTLTINSWWIHQMQNWWYLFLYSQKKRLLHSLQIIFFLWRQFARNVEPIFWIEKKNSKCLLLKILPSMLSVHWHVAAVECLPVLYHSADYISFPLGSLGSLWNLCKWSSAHVYARGCKQCCKLHYCLWRVSIKPWLPFSYL